MYARWERYNSDDVHTLLCTRWCWPSGLHPCCLKRRCTAVLLGGRTAKSKQCRCNGVFTLSLCCAPQLKDELKETKGIKHYQVSRSLADNTLWCICEGACLISQL